MLACGERFLVATVCLGNPSEPNDRLVPVGNPDPPAGLSGRGKRFPYKAEPCHLLLLRDTPGWLARPDGKFLMPAPIDIYQHCKPAVLRELSRLARQAGKGADADGRIDLTGKRAFLPDKPAGDEKSIRLFTQANLRCPVLWLTRKRRQGTKSRSAWLTKPTCDAPWCG